MGGFRTARLLIKSQCSLAFRSPHTQQEADSCSSRVAKTPFISVSISSGSYRVTLFFRRGGWVGGWVGGCCICRGFVLASSVALTFFMMVFFSTTKISKLTLQEPIDRPIGRKNLNGAARDLRIASSYTPAGSHSSARSASAEAVAPATFSSACVSTWRNRVASRGPSVYLPLVSGEWRNGVQL